jgi:tetratricopeptide (TPR) repeat protein
MKILEDIWNWFLIGDNREIVAFIAAGVAAIIGFAWKIRAYVRKKSSVKITFADIDVPKVAYTGELLGSKPLNFPFSESCNRFFKFGAVDPVLDVTLVNHSDRPILIKSLGIEILSVAQTWFVGAVLEPHRVKVSEVVEITMPDVWDTLESRGFSRNFTTMADVGDIPPQRISRVVSERLSDPMHLDIKSPYRYFLELCHYRNRLPDQAVVRLLVKTEIGDFYSPPIYIEVAGNILHVGASQKTPDDDEVKRLVNLADKFYHDSDFSKAIRYLERAYDMESKRLGDNHPVVGRLSHNLGMAHYGNKNYKNAEHFVVKALSAMEKHFGSEDRRFAQCLSDLAMINKALGRDQAVREIQERIKQIHLIDPIDKSGGGEPTISDDFVAEMRRAENDGDYGKAISMNEKLLAFAEQYYGIEHELTAYFLNQIGALHWRKDNYDEAIQFFGRLLDIREANLGDSHPDVANVLNNLASAQREVGKLDLAETNYLRAIRILQKNGDGELEHLASVWESYSVLLEKAGRKQDALNARERAQSPRDT